MKIFLDTNIIIDFLTNRPPFTQEAIELFQLAESGKIELYTSTHVLANTHYVLKKYLEDKKLRETLLELAEMIKISDVTAKGFLTALRSLHKDFEDAVQITTAEEIVGIDYIITRNLKDFKSSSIPAISVRELMSINSQG
ncbi:PIN domain-containing protein [Algoriphagus kandeliae]|uniref:PIN domain-containing protein n=1 Tax=Algoriphagus kandeliae TaxID=2562278 RepID=A0A4Y9QW87_9BACT|nr:PIN domain-containing protein [Algoriphagus kandeliae]TFV96168.1 PIN domain-containing protein [Algoriphagus kandeliae]